MSYNENYEQWLNDPRLDEESRAELLAIKDDEKEKEYRFGGELEFGTAGMRGIIGCGMNMMNIYTVMRASEGLSRYISSLGEEAKKEASSSHTIREERAVSLPKSLRACLQRTGSKRISFPKCTPCPCFRMRCAILKR